MSAPAPTADASLADHAAGDGTNNITVTDAQLEIVRREMMNAAAESLEFAAVALRDLADVATWPRGTQSGDAQSAVKIAREDLDAVEALGWPRDETRSEWDRRTNASPRPTATT